MQELLPESEISAAELNAALDSLPPKIRAYLIKPPEVAPTAS